LNKVKDYLNQFANLYLIGRNGMHKYNNQDHSLLTAMKAVVCILHNIDKEETWQINMDDDYQDS
jgi:hypothetical protein